MFESLFLDHSLWGHFKLVMSLNLSFTVLSGGPHSSLILESDKQLLPLPPQVLGDYSALILLAPGTALYFVFFLYPTNTLINYLFIKFSSNSCQDPDIGSKLGLFEKTEEASVAGV